MTARLEIPEFRTEGEFQAWVIARARDFGWGISGAEDRKRDAELAGYGQPPAPLDGLVFHPRIMYRSEPGWPDLTLFRCSGSIGQVLFVECKTDKKTSVLSPRQEKVLDLLCRVFGVALDSSRGFVGDGQLLTVGVYVWRPSDAASIIAVLS